ncbi:MAG: tetratricopeptide repeat protein [Marinilabiliales bacterium]|nr:tetratricopeptide repeat protein [Marinilabiliales bacterium]
MRNEAMTSPMTDNQTIMNKAMKTLPLMLFFLALSLLLPAQPAALKDSLARGNQFYTQGKYGEAIKAYESVLAKGYESHELYYNLGNAFYKTNNITFAILNYERALILSPNNEDVKFNLEMAKRQVVDNIDLLPEPGFLRWWHELISSKPADGWGTQSIVTFFLFLIFFALFLFAATIRYKQITFWFAAVTLAYSLLTFSFASTQRSKLLRHNSGVITERSVRMKGSPSETGTELFILHEGLSVQITDKLGDWIEIRLADGNKGWIKENSLIRI